MSSRDDELDLDDLIDALSGRLRWATAHPDLSDYWTRRFDVLCQALSFDPALVDEPADEDDESVRWVLRKAATSLNEPPNPFRGILEGGALIVPIYRDVAPQLDDLAQMHTAVYRRVARRCFLTLAPELEHRTCSTDVLLDAGLTPVPPDPDLYW